MVNSDIEELVELFGRIERWVEKQRAELPVREITLSNLVTLQLRAEKIQYLDAIRGSLSRFLEFYELMKAVEVLYARAWGFLEENESGDENSWWAGMDEQYPDLFGLMDVNYETEEVIAGEYALMRWMKVSKFLEQKLFGEGTEGWSERFRRFLVRLPYRTRMLYCFVSTDGIGCRGTGIGSSRMLSPFCLAYPDLRDKRPRTDSLEDRLFFQLNLTANRGPIWLCHKEISIDDLRRRSRANQIEPGYPANLGNLLFHEELASIRLASKSPVECLTTFALSASEADDLFSDFAISDDKAISTKNAHHIYEALHRHDRSQLIEKLKECDPPVGNKTRVEIAANVYKLIKKHKKDLGNAIHCYMEGWHPQNKDNSLVCYYKAFEAIFPKHLRSDFFQNIFKKTYPQVVSRDHAIQEILERTFKLVNDSRAALTHGNSKSRPIDNSAAYNSIREKLENTQGCKFDESVLSDLVRRCILVCMLAMQSLREKRHELYDFLVRTDSGTPQSIGHLLWQLHDNRYGNLWDALYASVERECNAIGSEIQDVFLFEFPKKASSS